MLTNPSSLPPPSVSVYMQAPWSASTNGHNYIYDPNALNASKDADPNLQVAIELNQQQQPIICMDYKNSFVDFDGRCEIKLVSPVRFHIETNGNGTVFRCHRWGCECRSIKEIRKTLTRCFSKLSHQAFSNTLPQSDFIFWNNIIEDIDYADYYAKITNPIFVEARVIQVKKNKITVQRNVDDCFMNITGEALKSCSAWQVGDNIEMFVKLDKHNNVAFITHAALVEKDLIQVPTPLSFIEVVEI